MIKRTLFGTALAVVFMTQISFADKPEPESSGPSKPAAAAAAAPKHHYTPPKASVEACAGKSEGDACGYTTASGKKRSGACAYTKDHQYLMCKKAKKPAA